MKMCENHWSLLQAKVIMNGLGHLVRKDVRVWDFSATPTVETYDPLIYAWWEVTSKCIDYNGRYLAERDAAPPTICPLCALQERHEEKCEVPNCSFSFDEWLDHAVKDQLVVWERLNVAA